MHFSGVASVYSRVGSGLVLRTTDATVQRQSEVAREIAQAFLGASHPLELYRLALARVLPLVQADFASVFLRDADDPELLRLVCAQNWPQASARFLGQLRIRVGRGPTGEAVSRGRPVTVDNVFSVPTLHEWWEPAKELGFTALISLPLRMDGGTTGALSFYFAGPHQFQDPERVLLELVAAQLSVAARRSHRAHALERSNEELRQRLATLEHQLADAEEARRLTEEFLTNIGHELNTPLTSILGYASLLLDGLAGPLGSGTHSAIANIDRAGAALQHLIADLLELSQLKLGRAGVSYSMADPVELYERALANVGPPPQGVDVAFYAPDGRFRVETDADKVVKILENLLVNAYRCTEEGRIEVTLRRIRRGPAGRESQDAAGAGPGRTMVEWVVRDNGIGVEPADLDAIFDEFRHVDDASARSYPGTGLGLALSLRLAHLLDGEIAVESEPGAGATFTLRLPARPATTPVHTPSNGFAAQPLAERPDG
jgi:signal transduction histidine kinase